MRQAVYLILCTISTHALREEGDPTTVRSYSER